MRRSRALESAGGRDERERRRRIAFFFRDYLDPDSRILELGPDAGSLEQYLREAGLNSYVWIGSAPPADLVGDVRDWRGLGLEAASFDLVIAIELPELGDCLDACHALLKPGGYLYLVAPIAGREWLARALAVLGLRCAPAAPPARRFDPKRLGGFQLVASRRAGWVEQWWRLRKPLDPAR